MRIARPIRCREADPLQQRADLTVQRLAPRQTVYLERLADNRADRHTRIQRAIRVLEDHLHLLPGLTHLCSRELAEVSALEKHLTTGGFDEPQERPADCGFATARLADQTKRFSGLNSKRYLIHRLDPGRDAREDSAANRKVFLEITKFHEGGLGIGGWGLGGAIGFHKSLSVPLTPGP